jgi:simple sugar transport system substrate-binding protein
MRHATWPQLHIWAQSTAGQKYLGNDPADLEFKVIWIGFWFNIPGFTSDPTQVATEFFTTDYDVVISGIDTTEALTEASRLSATGQDVWAVPYDYIGACEPAEEVCLGVPYFNWGPAYLEHVLAIQDGTWQAGWEWNPQIGTTSTIMTPARLVSSLGMH